MNNSDDMKDSEEKSTHSSLRATSPTMTSQSRSSSIISNSDEMEKMAEMSPMVKSGKNSIEELTNKLFLSNENEIIQNYLKFDFWFKEFMASADNNQVTPESMFASLTAMSTLNLTFNGIISEITKLRKSEGKDVSEDDKANIRKTLMLNIIHKLGKNLDNNFLKNFQPAAILVSSNPMFDLLYKRIFKDDISPGDKSAYFEFLNMYKNFIYPGLTAAQIHDFLTRQLQDDPNGPLNNAGFNTLITITQGTIQAISAGFANAASKDMNEILTEEDLKKNDKFKDPSIQSATELFVKQMTHSHLVYNPDKKKSDKAVDKMMSFFKELKDNIQMTDREKNIIEQIKKYQEMSSNMPDEDRSNPQSLNERVKIITELKNNINDYCKTHPKCALKDKRVDAIVEEEFKILTQKSEFQNNTVLSNDQNKSSIQIKL